MRFQQFPARIVGHAKSQRHRPSRNIIKDIIDGITRNNYTVYPDRAEAIQVAVSMARKGDVVVVAGKGHENYQEIKGERAHFDDRETVRELCREILSKQSTGRWPRRTE